MYAERSSVTITTDASGNGTGYIPVPYGRVLSIHYAKTDYADGVDFTVTGEAFGEGLWTEADVNAAKSVYPRAAVHDTAGAAAIFADAGEAIVEPVALANDRIKIVIANGGNTKTARSARSLGEIMHKAKKKFRWYPDGCTLEELKEGDERDFGSLTGGLLKAKLICEIGDEVPVSELAKADEPQGSTVAEEAAEKPTEAPSAEVSETAEPQPEHAPEQKPIRRGRPPKGK